MASRCLTIDPSKVYLLRFILEGYDNLFVLSTLDARSGLVEIHYVKSAQEELDAILSEIGRSIGFGSNCVLRPSDKNTKPR